MFLLQGGCSFRLTINIFQYTPHKTNYMINQLPKSDSGGLNSAIICLLFTFLSLFVTDANAQVQVFPFSGNGGNPALDMPICKSTAKWSSSSMLYPASGFNGGNGFGTIQKVGYYCDGAFFSGNSIPIKIWIGTVPTGTTTLAGSTWTAATSGATLVYSGNFNQGGAGGWCDITLTTPFTWSSGNIVVFVENDWGALTTVVGDPNWDYNTSTGNVEVNWSNNTSSAGLGSSSACCGTPDVYRADIRLTVNTCTAPTINTQPGTAAQTVCLNGSATALSVAATGTGTLTYQWYQNTANSNTGGTLISGATSSSYTPLTTSAGALYYYCVVDNGCSTISNTSGLVTINGPPATPGAISGPATVCTAGVNTYSITAVGGATDYTWTLPSGWSGTSTTNSISATQGTGGGTISVTANGTCGSSSLQTLTVTLLLPPSTPVAILGPDSVCASSTNTFSVASVNGATSYAWTLPSGWSGTSTTSNIQATEGTGPGTISVTAGNACGNSSAQTLAVTLASPPGTLGTVNGIDSGCATNQKTYSVVTVSGATSYTWALPNGWSGSSTTNSIVATLGTTGGSITVTANNACGSTSPQTLAVNVISPPVMPTAVIGPNSVCSSTSNIYSVSPVSGATSYTWTLPGSWTGSSNTDSINATIGASGGTISVTANGFCGSSSAQTLVVSLGGAPATPTAILGAVSACASSSNNTYSVNAVNGATSYTWTLPNGWSGTSTTATIITTAGSTGGTISVTANNACGSSAPQTLTVGVVSVAPGTPGSITQAGNACNGGLDTFSIATVNGATSYTWTLPNTWSGSSTTESISATVGTGGGNVTVSANNACGSSSAQTQAVTLGSVPAMPGTILGTASVCASSSNNTFSVNPVNGATSYTWTLPNGWTGTSTTATIITTAGSTGGTISVTANNSCGSSNAQTVSVTTISAAPATPGNILQTGTACAGGLDTFSITPVNGATSYTWTLPNTWTGSSTTSAINATVGTSTGNVTVVANNGCGSSSAQTLAVTLGSGPATPTAVLGPDSVCASSTNNTYAVNPVNGATSYTWTLPNGWTGTSTTAVIVTTAGSTGGTISVTANNACGSSLAQTLVVTANSGPATPGVISGRDSVCSGTTGFYAVFAVSGATSYTWTLPNTWSGTSTAQSINPTVGTIGGNVSVIANNACGSSPSASLNVSVLPVPQVAFTFPTSPVCNDQNPTVALSGGTPSGGTYSGPGVTGSTFDASTLVAGTYSITYSVTNSVGCTGRDSSNVVVDVCLGVANTEADQILVYPNPFNDAVTINIKGSNGNGAAILMDVTGREISRTEFEAAAISIQIPTNTFAKGTYLLNIMVDGKLMAVKKLVKVD